MKRNNIIMALTLTSLALLFSETECSCHVMETIKEKFFTIQKMFQGSAAFEL